MSKYDHIVEDVPAFRKRIGDHFVAGSNNTLMIFGTDRPGKADSGYGHVGSSDKGKGSGTVHIVVGRSGEDPSIDDDRCTLYMSMKTDVDRNAGSVDTMSNVTKSAGAIVRTDHVRIVARNDLKLKVGKATIYMSQDGSITIDGDVRLGEQASQRMVRGDALKLEFDNHTHPDPASGFTGTPVIPLSQNVLSRTRFVE